MSGRPVMCLSQVGSSYSLTARKSSVIQVPNSVICNKSNVLSKRKAGQQMPVSLRHIIILADSSVSTSSFCETTTKKKRLLATRSYFLKVMKTPPPNFYFLPANTLKKGRKHCQRAPRNGYKLSGMIKVRSRLCKRPL